MQNVWYHQDEDLPKVCSTIIHEALNLLEIKIVQCEHKSGWETGTGLVKIELESNNEVKMILKKKQELRNSQVKELSDVFLRQSKKEEVLLMERNLDLVMRDMGVCENYVCVSSGHLVRRDCLNANQQWGGGPPRSQGRGHGSQGRWQGQGGGRPSSSRTTARTGPITAEFNPADSRVAQQEGRANLRLETSSENITREGHTNEQSIEEYMR